MSIIVLASVLAGTLGILAVLVLGIVSRATGVLRVSTPWPEAARSQNLSPGHVVPSDALAAYAKLPVGAMSASAHNFANVFERVDSGRVAIFASYDHPSTHPHPSRSCVVGFCRVPRGGTGLWVIGRRSLDGPQIGRGTFRLTVSEGGETVGVRTLRDALDEGVTRSVQTCFAVFADIGFPYDVILCDGWLVIPGPRPMYDDLDKYSLAEFVRRTCDLALALQDGRS